METRAQTNPDRFRVEQDAECYGEYVATGWREPEAQDEYGLELLEDLST